MVEQTSNSPPRSPDPYVLEPEELARRCAEQRALRAKTKLFKGARKGSAVEAKPIRTYRMKVRADD